MTIKPSKAIVAGWFSFQNRKATFGDVEAMRVVTSWLEEIKLPYDVAGNLQNGLPVSTSNRLIRSSTIFSSLSADHGPVIDHFSTDFHTAKKSV
jgi:hypothetical protein